MDIQIIEHIKEKLQAKKITNNRHELFDVVVN